MAFKNLILKHDFFSVFWILDSRHTFWGWGQPGDAVRQGRAAPLVPDEDGRIPQRPTFATSQPAGGMGWRSTPSSTSTGQTSSTTTSWPKSNPCRTSTMHSTSQNRSWGSWSSSTLKVTSERILCWNFFSSNSFMQVYTCQSYNSWVSPENCH